MDDKPIIWKKIRVRICVRKTFQNVLKLAKIGKNRKKEKPMIPNTSLSLRRLGSLGVLTTNPQVASSSRAGRANFFNYSSNLPIDLSFHVS